MYCFNAATGRAGVPLGRRHLGDRRENADAQFNVGHRAASVLARFYVRNRTKGITLLRAAALPSMAGDGVVSRRRAIPVKSRRGMAVGGDAHAAIFGAGDLPAVS